MHPSDVEHEQRPLLDETGQEIPDVYPLIHQIRADVIHYIDTPLTWADLTAPELTYSLVKPLEEKYAKFNNKATVFCFLLNRVHFIRDQNFTTASLNRSRGALCELLAIRTIRQWSDLLELAGVLVTSWPIFQGAPNDVLAKGTEFNDDFDPSERVGNAIELAIISNAKNFLKSSPCQKVIDAIWSGKCVYSAQSAHALLSDTYKRAPIHYYDPRKAPLLDHYRLKVPAIRSVLEYLNFALLFIMFVICLEFNDLTRINWAEGAFMIYALGFSLEKLAAMQEHGISVYIHGTWNGFDVAFVAIYIPYAALRVYGTQYNEHWALEGGMDCLALAACIMFPRLAFVTMSNNLMVLSLRSMFTEFFFLMSLAGFCFAGFLYCLWTLARGTVNYSPGQITWWMLDLYFGLDASGFEKASTFHPFFGPPLMFIYACLSNTLLLTVLVSILSHTFSTISSDAEAEARFRRAVATIEGVKADALFSYLPPLNLIALGVMLPASYILTPRWFHKVNVFMIRITAFPVLLTITFYERQTIDMPGSTFYDRVSGMAERVFDSLPRRLKRMTMFEGLAGVGSEIDAIFEIEDELNNESALDMGDADIPAPSTRYGPLAPSPARRPLSFIGHSNSSSGFQDLLPKTPPRHPKGLSGGNSNPTPPHSAMGPTPIIRPQIEVPRARKTSVLRGPLGNVMGANSTSESPLAQLFVPVVHDGDLEMDEVPPSAGGMPRRRLLSMTRLRRASLPGVPPPHLQSPIEPLRWPELAHQQQHQVHPLHATLQPPATVQESEEEDEVTSGLGLSTSPQPIPASKEKDMEAENPNVNWREWNDRIVRIEERQKRIEQLLEALVNSNGIRRPGLSRGETERPSKT